MAKKPSKALQVLAANLQALIARELANGGALDSQPKVAAKAKMDQKTLWRIVKGLNEPSLDKVEKIAGVFGLESWQLLVPGFDMESPPALRSDEEITQ